MRYLKKFNESGKPLPEEQSVTKLDYNQMMDCLERKYNFESRGFTGIPSTMDYDNHFNNWCNKHGLPQKDSKGKYRTSSQEFWSQYRKAEDGERAKPPYMDYWHYLTDINDDIRNGGYIYIPQKVETSNENTPQSSIELYKNVLKSGVDSEMEDILKDLIEREEEELKNPKEDPWKGWKQQITDLIFKEFGEFAEDGYLKVWVEW